MLTEDMIEAGDAILKRADFSFWEKMEEAEGHALIRDIYLAMKAKESLPRGDEVRLAIGSLDVMARQMALVDVNDPRIRTLHDAGHTLSAALVRSKLPIDRDELLDLLELGGDYAADVFNEFRDKTSECALRVERNLERFNKAHAALTAIGTHIYE